MRLPGPLCYRLCPRALQFALLFSLIACGGSGADDVAPLPRVSPGLSSVTVDGVGLEAPASVLYDSRLDVYLVSNVNGDRFDRDGNGFISRIRPNGRVKDLHWIRGGHHDVELHAPKGMALRGDILFVTDIDCVRLFSRIDGRPRGSICPAGANLLDDLTVDRHGIVYVTDSGSGQGWRGPGRYLHPGQGRVLPRRPGLRLAAEAGIDSAAHLEPPALCRHSSLIVGATSTPSRCSYAPERWRNAGNWARMESSSFS